MKIWEDWLRRQTASGLVMFLTLPFGLAATTQAQSTSSNQAERAASIQEAQHQDNDPGTDKRSGDAAQPESAPENPDLESSQTDTHGHPMGTSLATLQQQHTEASKPVGTAAAPYEKPLGAAVSRPAGAAIAPAKQRRARSILIKVGLLLGIGVAVGTVVALSSASPSRPN